MTAEAFIAKWRQVDLTERSAAQQHFLDLCELVGHPKPAEMDPTGESFTFERGAAKEGGGDGWTDVWKRSFFAVEYKGRHKDFDTAKELDGLRTTWLNPPEWTREELLEFPGTVGGTWSRYIVSGSEKKGIGDRKSVV